MKQLSLIEMENKAVRPKSYNITKANALVEARYRLSLTEQRIIFLMASKVQPSDEDFKTYRIYVKDLMDVFDVNRSHLYAQMVSMIRELMTRVISIRIDDEEYMDIHWIDKQVYRIGTGYVDVTFAPELKPFLLHLKERFTTYKLKNVVQLKSVYSIRIYELLKQYQGVGKRTITIEDLRKMLGIKSEEYKRYNDFKRYVITVAHREINEKSDICFDYKEIKLVRKVNELEFTIKQKKPQSEPDKAARVRAKEHKRQEKQERHKAERRKKIQAFIDALSPEDLAELTREAEELAKAEGGAHFRNPQVFSEVIKGYLFELAEKRMEK